MKVREVWSNEGKVEIIKKAMSGKMALKERNDEWLLMINSWEMEKLSQKKTKRINGWLMFNKFSSVIISQMCSHLQHLRS